MWLPKTFIFCMIYLGVHCGRGKFEVMNGRGYSITIKKFECTNSTFVSIYACKVKLIRGKFGEVSLGVNFLQSVPVILLRLLVERKTSANTYAPTVIDATFNLCEVTRSKFAMGTLEKMMTLFLPNAIEILKPFLHPCPYYGNHEMINVTIEKLTVPNILPTGDAKLIGTMLDRNKNILVHLEVYVYIKSSSLMQIN